MSRDLNRSGCYYRNAADTALKSITSQIGDEQRAIAQAERRVATARHEAETARAMQRQVQRRVDALTHDERLIDAVGDLTAGLWSGRAMLDDVLRQAGARADTDANTARADAAAAQRIVDAVGADGLLPASRIAEAIAVRCQQAEIPAWPGWRWLADTMVPERAAAFATARPEIASGVVVARPDLVDRAASAAASVEVDVAVWIGAVLDSATAIAPHGDNVDGDGTIAQVLLPHPGAFDRTAAAQRVEDATAACAAALVARDEAVQCGAGVRYILAALEQLWTELPEDPRPELTDRIRTAQDRGKEAESDLAEAGNRLDGLSRQ